MKLPPSLKLRRTGNNFFKLVISIAVSELAGIIGSFFTISAIPDLSKNSGQAWYAGLVKSALNPPAWIFGPAWTILYALMGIALFLVWKSPSVAPKERKRSVSIFFFQLFLNAIWSIIFFGFQSPGWAFIDIVLLWFAIIWTMVVFYKISRPAVYLLIPYLLWVSFASYLNYSIWVLN